MHRTGSFCPTVNELRVRDVLNGRIVEKVQKRTELGLELWVRASRYFPRIGSAATVKISDDYPISNVESNR